MERTKRGSYASDIATYCGRWVLVMMLGASVEQLARAYSLPASVALFSVAGVLFVGDMVTGSIEIALMVGDSFRRTLVSVVRDVWQIEGIQYLVGIVGAGAARYDAWLLAVLVVPICVVYVAFKNATELGTSTLHVLEAMADAIDLRDPYTGGHSRRVTALCEAILREMQLSGPDVDLVITAARIHDIGKIGIPDGILNKAGPLSAEERAIMETHSALGANMLIRYRDFARGVAIVRHHHERWDGNGYPDGKAGLDIPFGARVLAVADSFDAMTSDRPYRAGMSVARASQILLNERGKQWDVAIVDAFLRTLPIASDIPEPAPHPNPQHNSIEAARLPQSLILPVDTMQHPREAI